MHDAISLKKRLLISLWLLLLLGILLPFWFYHRDFKNEILAEAKQETVQRMEHIAWLVTDGKSFESMPAFNEWINQVGRQLSLRITYASAAGRVLVDSELTPEEAQKFENLAGRPEFLQAMNRDIGLSIRTSKLSKQEHIFVAKKITPKSPLPAGVLRIASPFSPVKSLLDNVTRGFLFLLAIIFVATLFLSWALIRRLRIPVSEMAQAVEAIGAGDFKRRIPGRDQELYPLALAINRMADNISSRIDKIHSREQHLQAVFDGMNEGVMVLNPRGNIVEVNRAFSEFSASREKCLGKKPLEVVRSLELQEACERILAGNSGFDTATALEVQLAPDRFFNVNIVKLGVSPKGFGAIIVFHDISKIKRLEKVRQDFVANVSRELNAPLVSVKTHIQKVISESAQLDEKARVSLTSSIRETEHLLGIVRDLLQLASLDSSPMQFQTLSANPAGALAAAWDDCLAAAIDKNVHLESNLPENGIDVAASFEQLVQVFRNLLRNGIKYSPEGGTLTIGHSVEGEMVTLHVLDEGPGIPRNRQDRIFERFYRAGKPVTDQHASSGLGLAIAKHIVQNHGGAIWVRSPGTNRKDGATFFFSMHAARERRLSDSEDTRIVLH